MTTRYLIGILSLLAFEPLFAATTLVSDPNDGPLIPTTVLNEVFVVASPIDQGNEQSSLTGSQAQDLQVNSVQDLNGLSPNVVYHSGGSRSFNGIFGARGLMNSLYFADPALVLYVDDVPYALSYANQLNSDSIQTIDILKGPQGDLFGQNGSAGVIQVTQDQPTDYWTGLVRNEYGSYQRYKTFNQVSGPIAKGVDFIGSVEYEQRDGYLKNVTLGTRPDGEQELNGRFGVRWVATDQLSFDLNIEHNADHDGVQRFTPIGGPRYQLSSQLDGKSDSTSDLQSFKTTYDADDFRVLFISSHRVFDLNPELIDMSFGGVPTPSEIDVNQGQYVEELRIESKDESDFKWSSGASYEHVTIEPATAETFAPGVTASSITHQINDSYALFGQIELKPIDKFSLQIGNRVQFDARSANRSYIDPTSTLFVDSQNRQYFNTAPKITGTYAITKQSYLFASTGLTFRPGGYAPFATATTVMPYGSERTWANSVGWRMNALDDQFTTSLTLFWNETHDYQLERYTFPLVNIVNVQEVSSRGVEWNVQFKPVPELTLESEIGYTLATFDDYHDGVTGQDYAGNRVPYVPEETLMLGATYRHPTGWMAHVDFRGFGPTYYDQANSPLYRQTDYGLLASKIGYESKHWSAYVYGENLTGTQYDTLIDSGLGLQVPGDPRTVGVGLDLKW